MDQDPVKFRFSSRLLPVEQRAALQLALLGVVVCLVVLAFSLFGGHLGQPVDASMDIDGPPSRRLIDLNKAEAWEIALIPGIGEKKAGKIVDYRNKAGSFSSMKGLELVPGIGPALRARLQAYCKPLNEMQETETSASTDP